MLPGEDAPAHGAGIVIELHLHERRTHPRHLAAALLRARAEPWYAPRQPPQQPETGEAKRDRDIEPAARAEQPGDGNGPQPASGLQDHRGRLRLDLGEGMERPQQQCQQDDAEDKRHYDLICSRSLRAPAWWRAERSASARIPPAA